MDTPTIAAAIVTCDRTQFGKENYVFRTIESLRKAGFFEQIDAYAVFDAGPRPHPLPPNSFVHQVCKAMGEKGELYFYPGPPVNRIAVIQNVHRAFAWMVSTCMEYCMWLPDDCLACKNVVAEAKRWIRDCASLDLGILALHSRYEAVARAAAEGKPWIRWPGAKYYGGIGSIMRRDVVLRYLLSHHRQQAEMRKKGVDMELGFFMRDNDFSILSHCPNLFHHIGVESCIGNVHEGQKDWWPGEDYDALAEAPIDYMEPEVLTKGTP